MSTLKKLLVKLDDRAHSTTGWGLPFGLNVAADLLLGFVPASLFAAAYWLATDWLIPVSWGGFFDVWLAAGPARFFQVLNACGLGQAWLDRLDVAAGLGLVTCLYNGEFLRRRLIDRGGEPTAAAIFCALMFATAVALSSLLALYNPGPVDAKACVRSHTPLPRF